MSDFSAVAQIIQSSNLPDWDKEFVAAGVEKAYEKWFASDSKNFIYGVELSGKDPVPHKIDVVMQNQAGKFSIVDWKTKNAGKLDESWINRESRSPQKSLYAAALRAAIGPEIYPLRYEVRGVTMEEKPQVKVITFNILEAESTASLVNIRGVQSMRDGLIERGKTPWPLNEGGCRAFGPQYPCEFENVCWRGAAMPQGEVKSRTLSHSARQEFLRCPERSRLLSLTHDWDAEKEDNKGDVFHRCMEFLYKELKG